MREEIRFIWRIKWGGKWTRTSVYYTEEGIRKEHPEAIVVEGSRKVSMVPSTDEECNMAMRNNSTNPVRQYTVELQRLSPSGHPVPHSCEMCKFCGGWHGQPNADGTWVYNIMLCGNPKLARVMTNQETGCVYWVEAPEIALGLWD